MISREKLLAQAVEDCLQELYSVAQPSVTWENFKAECVEYNEKNSKISFFSKEEPRPFEFYYLPKQVIEDIVNSYIHAYRLNQQQELLNTIEILKNYCKEPIIEKYIEGENGNPGYKGYEHSDNLETEIVKILGDVAIDNEYYQHSLQDKFFEFLDMAGKFYNWTSELNSFITSIYLGVCPSTNKQSVIDNWKKYRNQDIEIDEEKLKKNYYGEEGFNE